MARSGSGELSASMAVLGLVIEEPDCAAGIAQRLAKRFRPARFAPSTAHMALPRLEDQGFVRRVELDDAADPPQCSYEATPSGIARFRRWLRTCPASLPALREELHARIDLAQPTDLERVIAIADSERLACEREYAAAYGRLAEAQQFARRRGASTEWSELVREVVMVDEAMIWGYRAARLERLRARLESLRGQLAPAEGRDARTPLAATREPVRSAG